MEKLETKTLCIVCNTAPHYRRAIFNLIEQQWQCNWYFGPKIGDIPMMPLDDLKCVHTVSTLRLGGSVYWQRGVVWLISCNRYDTFLMLGDPYCLSTWFALLLHNMFYPRKRVYLWTHGWYGKETWLRRMLKKNFFQLASGVFLYGNYARELMIKNGFDAAKLYVIHNSLNYGQQLALRRSLKPSDEIYRAHFGNENKNIVFVGRLTQVKSLDLLIEALRLCKDKGNNYNVTFIGDGSERIVLQQLVQNYDMEDIVWFYGACYDERTNAELIYNADLCVSPGNVGLTAMHALMFGCPVITHSRFELQMPEFEAIKPGVTGNFFLHGSTNSLAEVISEWFANNSNNTSREKIRQACYREIDIQWTPEYQLELLKTVIDTPKP